MRVTQSIESNANILASSPLIEKIASAIKGMPFNFYICEDITDAFMIPCFVLILDGALIKEKDNNIIDTWECSLSSWSGKRKKCLKCRKQPDCAKEIPKEDAPLFSWPQYKEPAIIFNVDKRERDVEGLVSLIPPMSVTEPFSNELEGWIKSTCLQRQRKALKWRDEFEKWHALQREKDAVKPKTFAQIAKQKWRPKGMTFELPSPEFEEDK